MRAAQRASLLVAFSWLTSAATASAECAWYGSGPSGPPGSQCLTAYTREIPRETGPTSGSVTDGY
jgi:hypothetical protein